MFIHIYLIRRRRINEISFSINYGRVQLPQN
jgi:hypothetical protein